MDQHGQDDPRARLAVAVSRRRIELGFMSRASLVKQTNVISERTLGDVEKQRKPVDRYAPSTIFGLESLLRWAPGSVDRILAGLDPLDLPGVASPPVVPRRDERALAQRDPLWDTRSSTDPATQPSRPLKYVPARELLRELAFRLEAEAHQHPSLEDMFDEEGEVPEDILNDPAYRPGHKHRPAR